MKGFALLKGVRVLTALAVFCLLAFVFLDFKEAAISNWAAHAALSTQFAPSLLRLLATGSLVMGAVFILFTLLALIFGRAYCSFVCPFGILMDVLHRLSRLPARLPLLKKTNFAKGWGNFFKKPAYAAPKNYLRYGVLAVAVLLIAFGAAGLLGLLEPYSLFGKTMTGVFRPALIATVNTLSGWLYARDIYWLDPVGVEGSLVTAHAFLFGLFVFVGIAIAASLRARVFCNTLCPVGAFLSVFSRYSLFKIRIDKSACIGCKKCERQCKAQCIDSQNAAVDASRCVLCFNCVAAADCPRDGIRYGLKKRAQKPVAEQKKSRSAAALLDRRAFSKAGVGLAGLACARALGADGALPMDEATQNVSPYPLKGTRPDKRLCSPPGSLSVENFLEHCTACQACTSSCPTGLLRPSLTQWGLAGFMQPMLDFGRGFCVHECVNCARACPTGAILPLGVEEKKRVKIGTARFEQKLCVVVTDGTDCAACAEHCPVQAIEMLPYKPEQSLYIPHVHTSVCIGCGACEHICPVRPHQAIVIQGLAKHETAQPFTDDMRLFKPQTAKPAAPAQPGAADNPFPF